MNALCQKSSKRRGSARAGLTLVEVMAGLLILGTLLASVTIARGRFIRQWSDAERKLAAVRWADAQIAQWLSGPPASIPVDADGTVDGVKNCVWRTRLVPSSPAASLGTSVVRLELTDPVAASAAPLVAVEFLVRTRPFSESP